MRSGVEAIHVKGKKTAGSGKGCGLIANVQRAGGCDVAVCGGDMGDGGKKETQ